MNLLIKFSKNNVLKIKLLLSFSVHKNLLNFEMFYVGGRLNKKSKFNIGFANVVKNYFSPENYLCK